MIDEIDTYSGRRAGNCAASRIAGSVESNRRSSGSARICFVILQQRLPQVVQVNFVALSLHDPDRDADEASHSCRPMCRPTSSAATKSRWTKRPQRIRMANPTAAHHSGSDRRASLAGGDLTDARGRDPFRVHRAPDHGAPPAWGRWGSRVCGRQAYDERDGEFLEQVGKQVAVAVDNVLHHQDLTRDRDRLRLLLEVSESIASHRDLDEFLRDLAHRRLPHIVPFDYINVVSA